MNEIVTSLESKIESRNFVKGLSIHQIDIYKKRLKCFPLKRGFSQAWRQHLVHLYIVNFLVLISCLMIEELTNINKLILIRRHHRQLSQKKE